MRELTKCDKCPNWFYCVKDWEKCAGYPALNGSGCVLNTPEVDIDGEFETTDVE